MRYSLHYLCPQCVICVSEFLLFPWNFWSLCWSSEAESTSVIQALHRPPRLSGWHSARLLLQHILGVGASHCSPFAHTIWSQRTPALQLSQIQPCIWISAVPLDSLHSFLPGTKKNTQQILSFLSKLTIRPADYSPFPTIIRKLPCTFA